MQQARERRRRLLMAGVLGGGGDGITMLLEDAPVTAIAAGSLNGTLATDGINTRTVVDTTSKLATSVANGIEFTGVNTVGDPGIWYNAQTRVGGLAVCWRVKPVSNTIAHRVGWDTNQSGDITEAVYFAATAIRAYYTGNQRNLSAAYTNSNGTSYDIAAIYRSTAGVWLYIKGGSITDWRLIFVYHLGSTSPVYPAATDQVTATGSFYAKKVKAGILSQFVGQYANAYARTAVSVNSDTITADSGDALIEHTITAATGVTQELMVRRTDDNNCIIIRMDFTGATIKVYKKVLGVETELTGGTTAQTWVNGQAYRIFVLLQGSIINVTVDASARNDASDAFNATVTGVKVSHAGTDLIAWPNTPPAGALAQLNAFFP